MSWVRVATVRIRLAGFQKPLVDSVLRAEAIFFQELLQFGLQPRVG